ncbi:MAG: phage portal protein [Sulfurimonas sp.]|jgi:HK97 family phage portal protein
MKIPFTSLEIKKSESIKANRVNDDKINILYEQLLKFFGKGQLIYNKNDLTKIINEGYLFNPDVYSIINKIIQTASMIDWQLYEIKDEKAIKQYKSYRGKGIDEAIYYQSKALEPVEQPEITKLLNYPNEQQTSTLFTQSLLGYYCLLGNSYLNKIEIAGNKYNVTGEMQVLPAYLVKIVFSGSSKNMIDSYSIENFNDVRYNFPKETVYHFKSFNPSVDSGMFMYGAAPTFNAVLTKSNDSYIAATELIRNLGAMGILSTGNDDTIDSEKTRKMEARYADRFGGASKRGKIWIVGHKMEYQNIAQSITDLNLIQGQEQDFLTLCRLLNVDSRIMGYVKGSTFSNMQEARKDFLQNRILPLKYMESEAYNTFILPAFSKQDNKKYYLDVDTKAIPELQVDIDKLSTRIQNEIKSGIIKPAEAAKMLGYPELTETEANQLWVGTNLIPMKKANEPKQIF